MPSLPLLSRLSVRGTGTCPVAALRAGMPSHPGSRHLPSGLCRRIPQPLGHTPVASVPPFVLLPAPGTSFWFLLICSNVTQLRRPLLPPAALCGVLGLPPAALIAVTPLCACHHPDRELHKDRD